MDRSNSYSGMVNMRKLTMFNAAAFGSPSAMDKATKEMGTQKGERRMRNDRRRSDRRSSEP